MHLNLYYSEIVNDYAFYISFVLNIPAKDKSKLKKNSKRNMSYILELKGLINYFLLLHIRVLL